MTKEKVILEDAALEKKDNGKGKVLRGRLVPDSLALLKIPDYQREILSGARANALKQAFVEGAAVPDIVLGLRGHKYTQRDDRFFFADEVYIIDGLQRVNAARAALAEGAQNVSIGASVLFDTNEPGEREIFYQLNAQRTKLSPSILVRNMRYDNQAIALLHQYATTEVKDRGKPFPLYRKICWDQRARKGEVINASSCIKVIARFHGHIVPGGSSAVDAVARSLGTLTEKIGDEQFIANVTTFFETVDEAWTLRDNPVAGPAPWLKETFLSVLARLFSRHSDFWSENELKIRMKERRKLHQFSVADPQIIQLAGSSGQSRDILYGLLRAHVNKGRRAGGHLKLWKQYQEQGDEPEQTIAESEESGVPENGDHLHDDTEDRAED